MSLAQLLEGRSKRIIVGGSLLLVFAIGCLDYATGYAIFFSAFYLLPVALSAWFAGAPLGMGISALSVTVWLAGDIAAGVHYSSWLVPLWNGMIALTVYFVVVRTLVSLRRLNQELETRVRQRTAALDNEMEERRRLERVVLEIGERSQRQISHDLHDVLGQQLTATAFASQVLTERLEGKLLPEAAEARNLVELIEAAIRLTRTLARGLQPVEMDARGLMDGFQELARHTSERFKVSCEFECREPVLVDDAERSTQLYRIAQEAITNAIKHGKAKFINVSLEQNSEAITLAITDDGTGLPHDAHDSDGMGLRIMAHRSAMMAAAFHIERLPESGTRVTCRLPFPKPEPLKASASKD